MRQAARALGLLVLFGCGSDDSEGSGAGASGGSAAVGGSGGTGAAAGQGGTTSGGGGGAAGSGGASGSAGSGGTAGGSGGAGTCKAQTDCACGQLCTGGACVESKCAQTLCPAGRTCTCSNGVLSIDGTTGPQWQKMGDPDVVLRRRPMAAGDDNMALVLRNYRVHDVTNQKALHVTLGASDQTFSAQYGTVRISCIEIEKVYRDEFGAISGLHLDYIKIDGAIAGKPPAHVFLEDIDVHDGNVYSLISDAAIDTLVLRRVKHVNTQGALQIGGHNAGHINELTIDQSPGLHIALLDAKIDHVTVTKSAGMDGTESQKDAVVMKYDAESCPNRPLGTKECCETAGKTCP